LGAPSLFCSIDQTITSEKLAKNFRIGYPFMFRGCFSIAARNTRL